MMKDILQTIEGKEIILKIDIEGYECKALQPEILLNKVGKFIPFIIIEWLQLPTIRRKTCPEFTEWVKHFYSGGYVPVNPGKENNSIEISDSDNSIVVTLNSIKEKDRDSFKELAWVHQSVLNSELI